MTVKFNLYEAKLQTYNAGIDIHGNLSISLQYPNNGSINDASTSLKIGVTILWLWPVHLSCN